MEVLQNKIDFTVLIRVENANPNGDPLNGKSIFVQSSDRKTDDYSSLSERASGNIKDYKNSEEYAKKACEQWMDVRAFGQVFAFKPGKDKKEGVSVGVRGPVSIHQAVSCSPVDINSMQITKSVNSETSDKKGSDTMGTKHFVEFGLYRVKGSINVQLAEKTGFSENDARQLQEALRTLFINDASSARPDGSMEVVSVYWWRHDNKIGQYSAAKVHDSLKICLKEGVSIPACVDDYEIKLEPLPGLEPVIINGI